MTKKEILQLQQMKSYPSVSITLPTHRTFPDNKQDKVLLDDLLRQAKKRLLDEFKEEEVAGLIQRLESLAAEIDHQHNLEGLALFVNKDFGKYYRVPFSVPERVILDDTFLTRDLVFTLNRSKPYWLLVLSEKSTRLYHGIRTDIFEAIGDGFPMAYDGPGSTEPLPGGFGIEPSKLEEKYLMQFFRQVDEAFHNYWKDAQIPVVVAGVEHYLAMFEKVTSHGDAILTSLKGNYDDTPVHELGKLAWEVARRAFDEKRKSWLDKLEDAVSANYYASTIGEAWRAVKDGRARALLVEQDFHQPAHLNDDGYLLYVEEKADAPGVIDDAVDDLIELMMAQGGEVIFVENGDLEKHQRVAVITRY
ncbi:MAG: hypothetical protein CMN32_07915 [Saprospirales bacterium]|nr:hypothetical protein [Saprospirales bacterium]